MLFLTLAMLAASEPAFSIDWNVPCAAAPEVSELVGSAKGKVEVEIAPEGNGWRLRMNFVVPASGERVMHTATCEEAAQAALVLVRLSARGQRAPPLPINSTQVPEVLEPEPPPPPPSALHGSIALGVLAQHGPLPTVASRLALTFGLEWGSGWGLFLSGRGGLPTVLLDAGARVTAQPLIGGQLSFCWFPRAGRFAGGPCAALGAEAWEVKSENVGIPRTSTAASVGAGIDARGSVQLWSGLSLTASIGARVALVRPSVYFRDSGVLFQSSPFAAEGELGIRWTW